MSEQTYTMNRVETVDYLKFRIQDSGNVDEIGCLEIVDQIRKRVFFNVSFEEIKRGRALFLVDGDLVKIKI